MSCQPSFFHAAEHGFLFTIREGAAFALNNTASARGPLNGKIMPLKPCCRTLFVPAAGGIDLGQLANSQCAQWGQGRTE
jgi:hypothetical protein